MPNGVYHRLTPNDRFETGVTLLPSIIWWSGSGGLGSNFGLPSGSLSLYGGVRMRSNVFSGSTSGLQVYPLNDVDTHSIDKVIQVKGRYPATGTINLVRCTNTAAGNYVTDVTDIRWYDTHYRAIENLYRFYERIDADLVLDTASHGDIRLLHIPSMFYGRQMATGTVVVTDWTHTSSSGGPYVFVDSGRGSLFLSGTHNRWGAVFYTEGLVVMTPPVPFILGQGTGSLTGSSGGRHVQLQFSGTQRVITKTFMCRIHENECNCSLNPTWSSDISGTRHRDGPENITYITAIGLYNEDYELVAVAKIAQSIRKREMDRLDIRLRMDM
jgi:hypothetical protein